MAVKETESDPTTIGMSRKSAAARKVPMPCGEELDRLKVQHRGKEEAGLV